MRVVIRNAHLVDKDGDHGKADLYLDKGLIQGRDLGGPCDLELDASGHLVTPAFVELHAQFRDPGFEVKEDLQSGLSAACAGGFGTVVSMPNTDPAIDDPALITSLQNRAKAAGQARLKPAAALSRRLEGQKLSDFAALQAAGAVMVTDGDLPVKDAHLMRRACEYAGELDLLIQTHSEDTKLAQKGVMNEGRMSQRLGLPGQPASAEAIAVYRNCELALMTGARVHIAQVSTKRSMEIIEWFKEKGALVTAEVTPHHLLLTDESMALFNPYFKVSPPLRTSEDVEYLRKALQKGSIDNISTAHAPHTRADKEFDLLLAPSGMANLEIAFPLLYSELVQNKILHLETLLSALQEGPANVMKWSAPSLKEGSPADITIIDLETPRAVQPHQFKTKAKYSAWEGQMLKGWPIATFIDGKLAFQR